MQGTMDIMAIMQKSSIVAQKTSTTSLSKDFDNFSFKRELADARKNSVNNKRYNNQFSSVKQEVIVKDNKSEKLARVMSGNNVKAEKALNSSEETAQIDEIDTVKKTVKVEKSADEAKLNKDTELDELVKSAEELLQQLLQLLNGESNTEVTETNVKQIVDALQTVVQKLEQIISKPFETESGDSSVVLKDLKVELKELLQKLNAGTNEAHQEMTKKPNLQQTVTAIKHLINKMNEIQPKLQQKFNQPEMTKENPEQVQEIATSKSKDIQKSDSNPIEIGASNENVNLKPVSDDSNLSENTNNESKEDEKASQSKTEIKEIAKPVVTTDKTQTEGLKDVAIPQNSKAEFQINVKDINLNFKKSEMVVINKSEIVNQVIKKADITLHEGHSEMVMKLEPESLGKLNLKIVVENGLTTAKFIAESKQVKEVIESSFNQLKDALQEKGIAIQNISVSVGQQFGEQSSQQSFNQWKQSIKIKNKSIGGFMELEDELMLVKNPYSFHEGKVDYRA